MTENETQKKEKIDLTTLTPDELDEYKRQKRKTIFQALKYALCTASAGLIEFISFSILNAVLPKFIDPTRHIYFIADAVLTTFIATTVALILSVLWNFTINRKLTFKSAGNVPRAMFLAFFFYVPFYPFKIWFNSILPSIAVGNAAASAGLSAAAFLAVNGGIILGFEICSMLINGILEFCWQKFVIYRKEEDTALAKYNVGEIGPNGEITTEPSKFSGAELSAMLSAGLDINKLSDKQLTKWLRKNF